MNLKILVVLVLLCSSVSATRLEFETIFPECVSNDDTTDDFMESMRCSAFFLVPNFHVQAFWDLTFNAFFDSLQQGGFFILERVNAGIEGFSDLIIEGDFKAGANAIRSFAEILGTPIVIIFGILSSVVVYGLLILWEFLKTYLLIGVTWSLWSAVLFGEIRGKDALLNSSTMAFVIVGALIIGSILLLVADVTIWGVL